MAEATVEGAAPEREQGQCERGKRLCRRALVRKRDAGPDGGPWRGVLAGCAEEVELTGWSASKSWLEWAQLGKFEVGEAVLLDVDLGDRWGPQMVEVEVVERQRAMGEGSLWVPAGAIKDWEQRGMWEQPTEVSAERLVWGAEEVERLETGGQEQWMHWWSARELAATAECLNVESGDVGGPGGAQGVRAGCRSARKLVLRADG